MNWWPFSLLIFLERNQGPKTGVTCPHHTEVKAQLGLELACPDSSSLSHTSSRATLTGQGPADKDSGSKVLGTSPLIAIALNLPGSGVGPPRWKSFQEGISKPLSNAPKPSTPWFVLSGFFFLPLNGKWSHCSPSHLVQGYPIQYTSYTWLLGIWSVVSAKQLGL